MSDHHWWMGGFSLYITRTSPASTSSIDITRVPSYLHTEQAPTPIAFYLSMFLFPIPPPLIPYIIPQDL